MRELRVQIHRSGALAAGLGALLAVLACAPAAFGAEIGVNVSGPPTTGASTPPNAGAGARYMDRLKPRWVREWLWWSSTEPTPGAVQGDVLSRLGASAAALQAW